MMRSLVRIATIGTLVALLAACGSSTPATPAAPGEAEAQIGISLDAEEQQKLGIATATIMSASWQPTTTGPAAVLDPQALIAAMAEQATAAAGARASQAALQRARNLFGADTSVSAATLEAAERQAAADAAQLEVARTRAALGFGASAPWLVPARRDALLDALARGTTLLVRASFPGGLSGAPTTLTMRRVSSSDGESWTATELWPAPADPSVPGPTLLALLPADSGLHYGERLTASVPTGDSIAGALLPRSAVVIAGGQAWCYVESGEGQFERRSVTLDRPLDAGYFQQDTLAAGSRVVTNGAGLLLARELGGAAEED